MSQDVGKADATELMLLKVNVKNKVQNYGQKAAEKPSHSYNLFFFFLDTLTLFRGLWIPGKVTLSPFTPLTSRST